MDQEKADVIERFTKEYAEIVTRFLAESVENNIMNEYMKHIKNNDKLALVTVEMIKEKFKVWGDA